MIKCKLESIMLIIMLLLILGGCRNNQNIVDAITTSSASTSDTTVTPAITPATDSTASPIIIPPQTLQELSMEAYEKFMKNEMKVYFDRFMTKGYLGNALYEKEIGYTLSELLRIVTGHYFEYSDRKKIEYMDYSYIDCGKDGVNELVLRLNGMKDNEESTLVYIIKYADGRLSVCYYYETWARSESTINKYGYYQSKGSGGASNHGEEYGVIDKDGNWQFIASVETELDINQLAWSDKLKQLPKVAEAKGVSGNIELITICFDNNGDENKECFYTFEVYDDNRELIKDENLYTNSIYKEIFDEALVPFTTPDEVSKRILEKEEKVGATAEIKEGAELTWTTLSGSIFADYVER